MSDTWIQTFTGRRFDVFDPRPDDVDAEDIAHALSNLCRFNGHVREFYSVGQHGVLVSQVCDPEVAFAGLLHDAGEAYCVDLPSPIKRAPGMALYREVEERVRVAVFARFGLPPELPASVRHADRVLLVTEARDLARANMLNHVGLPPPLSWRISPLAPAAARRLFLDRLRQLQRAAAVAGAS